MRSEATLTGVIRSLHDGSALIAVAKAGCAACGKKSGCAIGRLADDRKPSLVKLPVPAGLLVGDEVALTIPHDTLLRAALIGYLWPAVMLVIGTVIGQSAAGADAGAAIGAVMGLLVGLVPGLFNGRRPHQHSVRITRHAR